MQNAIHVSHPSCHVRWNGIENREGLRFPTFHNAAVSSHRRMVLVAHSGIVERHTDCPAMVTVVLSDDALSTQLPEPRVMVRAACNQIRTVCRESAVPDPSLVAMQRCLQRESSRVAGILFREVVRREHVVRSRSIDGPDTCGVVG
jgi:hypothetical protein